MRINVTARELLERESLIDAALAAQIAFLTCEASRDARIGERLGKLSHLLVFRVGELRVAQEARSIVEGSYLDGHGALFPDTAEAWDEQVRSSEAIAEVAAHLAELDGLLVAAASDSEAMPRRTTELVADLVEPAKAEALEKLDEGCRAFGIASEWVRAKLN